MKVKEPMPDQYLEGIDVSSHQDNIDWGIVGQKGIGFAYVRATIGEYDIDSRFTRNWNGIADSGLSRGAYHYFWPLAFSQGQAQNFLNAVSVPQPGDLPPALDLEEAVPKNDPLKHDTWLDVPFDQRLPMIQNWLDAVEEATGRKPIIYTRQNFIEELLGDGVQSLSEYPLWIAHYGVPQPSFPPQWASWTFWQYTDKGAVNGIAGPIDRN